MRIIGGTYGGRVIKIPKGLPVRPTTDRAREALFNILQHRVEWEETDVLDLFAGTGMVSLECISRGARTVVSVDKDFRCVQSIKTSEKALDISNARVVKMDVFRFVKQENSSYALIFMDPPYDMDMQEGLIEEILEGGLLAEDGLLIVEHRSQKDFSALRGWNDARKYGDSTFSFFEKG